MANMHTIATRFGSHYVPSSFVLRFGRREIFIGPDYRKSYASPRPILDCRTGSEAGYVEFLLFRKCLIVLSIVK